jgi:hypothetical protein
MNKYKMLLVPIFIGLSLSSCNEYPGAKTTNLVKMSANLPFDDSVGQKITIGGDCNIEGINDLQVDVGSIHHVNKVRNVLSVMGWAAISAKDGVMPSGIAISLNSRSVPSNQLFAPTIREKRADVANYFKNPLSVDTGFTVKVDLTDVSEGNYELAVILHKDGKDFKCPLTKNIIVDS